MLCWCLPTGQNRAAGRLTSLPGAARCWTWLLGPGVGFVVPPFAWSTHPLRQPSTSGPAPVPQEYTRSRVLQFAQAFASRLNPTVGPAVVQQAAVDCLASLPPPDYTGVALEQRDLQLVFRHDCL